MHAIAEVEQNLIAGRAVDLLATHFKAHLVCVAFTATGYRLCLKPLGLAPSAHLRGRSSATPELNAG
jgi:hypothetical protein